MRGLTIKKYILLLFIAIILGACPECPTALDPGPGSPVEFSNLIFINASPEIDTISVRTFYINDTVNNLLWDRQYYSYKKIGSGSNYITAVNSKDSTIISKRPAYFLKNSSYTCIFYGSNPEYYILLLADSVPNYLSSNVYIRCVNIAEGADTASFEGAKNYPVSSRLKYGEYSAWFTAYSGKNNVDVAFGQTNIEIENYYFKPGKLYSIILRGSSNNNNGKKIEVLIAETAYPY
jgi:hypothetical protein